MTRSPRYDRLGAVVDNLFMLAFCCLSALAAWVVYALAQLA